MLLNNFSKPFWGAQDCPLVPQLKVSCKVVKLVPPSAEPWNFQLPQLWPLSLYNLNPVIYLVEPKTNSIILSKGTLLDENNVVLLEKNAIDEVWVRSAITCDIRHGVCAKCYGRDLAKGRKVSKGEAVGVVAAQSIGEPGTQLTMRTFHIGGAASRAVAANSIEVKNSGTVRYHNLKTVINSQKEIVTVSR